MATSRDYISTARGEDFEDEEVFDLDNINRRLISCVRVNDVPKKHAKTARISAIELPDPPLPKTFVSTERKSSITPESLAEKWYISTKQHPQAHDTANDSIRNPTAWTPLQSRPIL
jgi:hypothetical protein